MDSVKILLMDDDEQLVEMIKKYFKKVPNIEVRLCAKNGKEGIKRIENNLEDFDLLLLDIVMPEKDGIDVLEYISQKPIHKKIMVMTAYQNPDIIHRIASLGVNYIMLKPFELKDLEDKIHFIMNNSFQEGKMIDLFHYDLQGSIIHILHELGVPSHIKGYEYIKEGILSVFDNNICLKDIYREIAEKYNSTISRVERSIRHAIETSWNRGNWDLMEELFGHSIDQEKAKPTNSEFIITIAEKLKLEFFKEY